MPPFLKKPTYKLGFRCPLNQVRLPPAHLK